MSQTRNILKNIWSALRGPVPFLDHVAETGQGGLTSAFAVTDFATASLASAGLALAELSAAQGLAIPEVSVDRRLSSFWFAKSIRPIGWTLPPQWDPIAGNYATKDGFIRLHTNAAHHRAACLRVLGCAGDAGSVSKAVLSCCAEEVQEAVVAEGGVAAKMLARDEWALHPQGDAVTREPLAHWETQSGFPMRAFGRPERPLEGLRVLDLTRILAGPIATRFLAAYGADVLRIDPPEWDEPAVLPEVTPGKRRARLDLTRDPDRDAFTRLLADADVIVHGYRAGALEKLGFGAAARQRINPDLIDVTLNAYGWTGPWASRRGFDTIVQMSTGLAQAEMLRAQAPLPQQLPVQALDYGTGHMMAAAVIRALTEAQLGRRSRIRFSLARTAGLLADYPATAGGALARECEEDLQPSTEATTWGPARRLKAPLEVKGIPFSFSRPAGLLGSDQASFL
ncbi:MAG: hypothetical protein RIQ68_158 [Pseudomonadota bacterium]